MENKLSILNINHEAKRYNYIHNCNNNRNLLDYIAIFFSTKKVNDTYWDSAAMDGILYAIKH